MAVTSIWKVEGRLARVLGYAGNPDKAEGSPDEWELQGVGAAILYAADPGKTERQLYVTGVNCLPATALEEMNATKRQYGKTGGIVAFHGYQAFAPGETDPATAHEVGVALAQELWGGRFEVVVATHLDKAHLHNHFVVNSVSFADGRRFHRDAACYRAMREASDELCREHGLSVVESPGRGGARHHAEWRAEREGRPTWRSLVKADVDEAVGRAASMRQFHANLRAMGYDVKVGKDISVRPPGKERFVRLRRNFGDAYSQEGISARILANSRQRLPLGRPRPAPKERPPVPKGTLVSLYRRYMALLNGAKRQRAPGGRAHFLLRVSATAKSAERATLSRRRRPRFPAGGATALWPPALPRAAAQGALDRGVVEVRGPDLNLQRRGALGVPGRDRPARDLPSAELREPDRHRDVLCAERGQPPRGVRGPHDCPLSGSPSPSAASASRSFMR